MAIRLQLSGECGVHSGQSLRMELLWLLLLMCSAVSISMHAIRIRIPILTVSIRLGLGGFDRGSRRGRCSSNGDGFRLLVTGVVFFSVNLLVLPQVLRTLESFAAGLAYVKSM
jgi:hypothetical protein